LLSKLSVIAGKSSEDVARKLSRKIKANFVKSQIRVFADGESKITLSGKRNEVIDKYGMGDIGRGSGEDE